MMLAAENSMLNPFFAQIITAIDMVRMVRRSSSSQPASLHDRATKACSKAKLWIIQAVLIFFMWSVAQNVPEVMDFALILQFSDFVHRRNSTIHPVLSTIRHKQKNRLIINVYFRRPIYNDKP